MFFAVSTLKIIYILNVEKKLFRVSFLCLRFLVLALRCLGVKMIRRFDVKAFSR